MSIPRVLERGRGRRLAAILANGVIQALAMAATAWLAQQVFEQWILSVPEQSSVAQLGLWPAILLTYLAVAGLRVLERVTAERLGQSYVHSVRLALYRHLSSLPPRVIQARSRGGHLLRFIGDLTAMRQWVSLGLARLAVAAVSVTITLVVLAFIDASVAAAAGAVIALAAVLAFGAGRWVRGAVAESRRRRARLAANVDEKLSAMSTIQALGQVRRERRRLAKHSRHLASAMVSRARAIGYLRGISDVANGGASVAVLLVGAVGVAAGSTSPGAVVAGMTVLGLCLPMVRDLARVFEYWQGYRVARDKISSFFEATASAHVRGGDRSLPDGKCTIELRDVTVGSAVRNVSVRAPAGTAVALVGPNGAGKSTLLNLICRLVEPDHGEVLLDGVGVSELKLSQLRAAVTVVSPDLPLLRGSLLRNLRYRSPRSSQAELARVCALCGVDKLVDRLPNGLQTRIADGGLNLSLGERTRIALARALLGRPRVLLLDETDAHLDAETRESIDAVIEAFEGTVVFATHDSRRTRVASHIWYLETGRVVAAGTVDELSVKNGPVRRWLADARLRAVA